MYRGDPPTGQLHKLSHSDVTSFSTKKANIKLDTIQIDNLPEVIKSFKLKVQYVSNDNSCPVLSVTLVTELAPTSAEYAQA
jgi:hypothetical protein